MNDYKTLPWPVTRKMFAFDDVIMIRLFHLASSLQWRHNDHSGVSINQPHDCLLNRLFGCRLKKTSKLRITGLCAGNSPGPVSSPHKGPVTRNMFPFDDVIMNVCISFVCQGYSRLLNYHLEIIWELLCHWRNAEGHEYDGVVSDHNVKNNNQACFIRYGAPICICEIAKTGI